MRHGAGGGEQVEGTDTRSHQRLMSVAESRVGNQQAFFFSCPGREFLRSELLQELPSAGWRFAGGSCRNDWCVELAGDLLAFHFRIAVEDDVAQIREQFGSAVTAAGETEKLGRVVEERGGDFAGAKLRVVHNIFDEGDIRFHTANAEFAEGAVHALAGFRQICAPSRDLDEQRIVIGGEHRAGIGGAPTETNTETCGGTISGNFPAVGGKVFLRGLGGHATLESRTIERNVLRLWQRHWRLM